MNDKIDSMPLMCFRYWQASSPNSESGLVIIQWRDQTHMTSLEQAKACAKELQREFGGRYFVANIEQQEAIIQKHMDAFARDALQNVKVQEMKLCGNFGLKSYLDLEKELTQLKEANRELLKDKERLDLLLTNKLFRVQVHDRYNNFSHKHIYADLKSREALDKAALAKERTE